MTPTPRRRGRFAPSPTGDLHFGSLVAALGSWLMARHAGGDWLVRMEDLDPPREVPGAAARQLQALECFGLRPDEAVVWQSQRGEAYAAALDRLLEAGLAFECRCSRSDLAATGGIHRACVAGRRTGAAAVRLRVPDETVAFDDRVQGPQRQALATAVGDFVLRRADGPWAYQLAVVVDDAAQGITDVVRGADLLDSTPRQIFLQRQLGLPTPAYAHLPLVVDAQGRKLGKSLAALPVDPAAPMRALSAAWRFLGQAGQPFAGAGAVSEALEDALSQFEPGRIPPVLHAGVDASVSGSDHET
jgi:glutamyl-Q tRNA(Asp) synthetase